MNERALKMMKTLDITYEEALELIEEDKAIDRMTKSDDINSDLTAEQRKTLKKCTNVAKGADAYGKKRVRTIKIDDNKVMIIDLIAKILEENEIDFEVINKQKTIAISIGDENFEIDLKKKRQPKK
jgi:hypothetical protein